MPRSSLILICILICVFVTSVSSQEIVSSSPAERPVSMGIVVDCSGSQRLLLEKMIGMVKETAAALRPLDETFLVKFVSSDKVTLVQEFTSDKEQIADSAEDLYIEGGQTAIVDAVNFSAHYFTESKLGAPDAIRALLLITDGDERESASKTDATINYLKEQKVRVYAIGISEGRVNPKLLDRLARETGGKVFLPRTQSETSAALSEILKLIRGEQFPAK